jgi:hypothetical protein
MWKNLNNIESKLEILSGNFEKPNVLMIFEIILLKLKGNKVFFNYNVILHIISTKKQQFPSLNDI